MATFSISATARKAQASGNGSAGPFSFAFQVNSQSEVDVFVDTTLKTLTTHYTVSLASNGTGTVSFMTNNFPSSSQTITIMGDAPLSRTSVYTSGGNITAAALESDFDTNVMVQQQQQEVLSRTVRAPVDDAASVDLTLPNKDDRKGKVLGFNATSGNPEVTTQVTGAAVNVSTVSVGGNATATVALSGGTATFALGIPTGATGATGATGQAGGGLRSPGVLSGRRGGSKGAADAGDQLLQEVGNQAEPGPVAATQFCQGSCQARQDSQPAWVARRVIAGAWRSRVRVGPAPGIDRGRGWPGKRGGQLPN